ncbi:MAG: hypothetical protein KO316_04575 [Methanobacterium sp.]|jgi:hypothetical protein|nr:hypothetical protein [Methanobacterium sp.]
MHRVKAKILAFIGIVIYMIIMSTLTKNIIFYVLAPLSVITFLIWCICEERLNEKYNLQPFDKIGRNRTIIIIGVILSPAFFITSIVYGITGNNVLGGLGLAITIIYPCIFMFIRMETFSNSISEKGGFGYFPASYFLFSCGIGIFTTFRGFSALNFYLNTGNPPLEFAIVAIFLGLLFQTIVLLPDQFNKIIPFDLRERKGLFFMFVITVLLYVISQDLIFSLI